MSTTYNPYEAPKTDFPEELSESEGYELATIVERALARVIDFLLRSFVSVVLVVILLLGAFFAGVFHEEPPIWLEFEQDPNLFVLNLFNPILWISIVATHVIFLLLHGVLLHRYGQTIGKRLLKIAIVDADTYEKVPLPRLFVLRYVIWDIPALFIGLVNWIIRIVDLAFGLREDRRTLHDMTANTIVIKV